MPKERKVSFVRRLLVASESLDLAHRSKRLVLQPRARKVWDIADAVEQDWGNIASDFRRAEAHFTELHETANGERAKVRIFAPGQPLSEVRSVNGLRELKSQS